MSQMKSEEDLEARHRKERKDLTNQITSLKKQATKKTRKQVNTKCAQLEHELELRHEFELKECRGELHNEFVEEVTPEQLLAQMSLKTEEPSVANIDFTADGDHTKKRRNRQKERLAKREAEISKMKQEAIEEAKKQPNFKQIEQDSLDKICSLIGLEQFDIPPDGHCLFNSILDQLKLRHSSQKFPYNIPKGYEGSLDINSMDVMALRSLSCNYVREHRDDFVPYLFDEKTMAVRDLDDYTTMMETTAQWGGEVELLALAKVFNCCISVLMSGRSTYKINEKDGENPELKLVYYKHTYTLGEHYNSLHDL